MTREHIATMAQESGYLPDGLLLLWHGEKPVGTVRIVIDHDGGDKVAFIEGLAVVPEYQGQALGKNLLRTALAFGRRIGLDRAILTVNAENCRAADLYVKEGFTKVRTMVCYSKRLHQT